MCRVIVVEFDLDLIGAGVEEGIHDFDSRGGDVGVPQIAVDKLDLGDDEVGVGFGELGDVGESVFVFDLQKFELVLDAIDRALVGAVVG